MKKKSIYKSKEKPKFQGEDSTKTGEFIASFDAWMPPKMSLLPGE